MAKEVKESMMSKCQVIAIANQKGSTGKTTTTVNLGIGLANRGKRVLLVDLIPSNIELSGMDYQLVMHMNVTYKQFCTEWDTKKYSQRTA